MSKRQTAEYAPRYDDSWQDAMLNEDVLANLGRFLWWVENADLGELSDDQMAQLHRIVSLMETLETEIESSDEDEQNDRSEADRG